MTCHTLTGPVIHLNSALQHGFEFFVGILQVLQCGSSWLIMCVCVCVFYGFGTAGRNEELISESSGKHSKRGRRSEERLSVLVRIKTRGSLSTSLLLRAAWERGLLIRTLIPDTPSACSVNYQAKYFVIHCAPLTAPASCFHTYTVSKMNLCQMLNASWIWWVNGKMEILGI